MGSLSRCPSDLSSTQGRFHLHWPGCQIHLCGLSNRHGTLNPHAWCFFNSVSRSVKEAGVESPFPTDTLPPREGGPPGLGTKCCCCLPAFLHPSLSTQTPRLPRLPLQGGGERIAARPPGWFVVGWIPSPTVLPHWPSVANKKHSFLSSLQESWCLSDPLDKGAWRMGWHHQLVPAGTKPWHLHFPFAPHGWPGRGEDRVASG